MYSTLTDGFVKFDTTVVWDVEERLLNMYTGSNCSIFWKVAHRRLITIQFAPWDTTSLSLYASDSELYTTCKQVKKLNK